MKKRTLLIIDDEPLILKVLKDALEDVIEEILLAENGKVGISFLENNKNIDCVICDIRMPVMNGVETIKTARSMGIETPFIFYTGHGDDVVMKEVAKYGVFDFLHKPKLDNLLSVINRGIKEGFRIKEQVENTQEPVDEYKEILEILIEKDEV